MINRVFLIVLDSLGIGNAPDAAEFGDKGTNTLKSISHSEYFHIPNLTKLGLLDIDGLNIKVPSDSVSGAICRLIERSKGKDTTVGHWEITGLISHTPLPTYPFGFPDEIIIPFCQQTGHNILLNRPYSGTEAIRDYGKQHMETGDLIVYTSADSVFQIAAHESIIDLDHLYHYCHIARKLLQGKHAVGRVVARPFTGIPGSFVRTSHRHDFSLEPPGCTLLDIMKDNQLDVIGIGKINDIFAGRGITEYSYTSSNADGMKQTFDYLKKDFRGLCFTNLVDFDMLYGHRNDVDGYAKALSEFDKWLPEFMNEMRDDDLLMITADHGCDPGYLQSTDHSREQIPLCMYGKTIKNGNIGQRQSYSDIAATIAQIFKLNYNLDGESFYSLIQK